ncbi:MAG: alpha-amylase family glycosyl hydrolase [Succinivibrio sp.]|nr:alpha-amylase family glycosyl hydrolase [Succinivibrio sp.]
MNVNTKFKSSLFALCSCLYLTACSSSNGVDEVTVDSVSLRWNNYFRAYNNTTGVVDPLADLRIYQVMVESFQNGDDTINYNVGYGPSDHKGDLQGIINAIPYIKSLGMNAIWLTPIFESAKENDSNPSMLDATGYYTRDYYKVDRRFGDEQKLKQLVDTAHANGLYVFLDGVFGHFRSDLNNTSPKGNKVTITQKCLGGELTYYTPPEHTSCADFDDKGQSLKYMKEVATYYVENFKIDGWRLDQAYQVPLKDLHEIKTAVEDISSKVTYTNSKGEIVHPLAYLVAEIWASNPVIAKTAYGYKKDEGLDSAFDFGMRYPIVQALATEEWMKADHSGFRLAEGLAYNENNLPRHALPNLMITNHDLLRFGDLIQRAGLQDTYNERIILALSYLAIVHSGPITNYYGEEIGQEVPNYANRVETMGYRDDHVARDNGKIKDFTPQEEHFKKLFTFLMNLRANHGSLSNGRMDLLKVNRELFSIRKSFKGDDDFFYFMNLSKNALKITLSKELTTNAKALTKLSSDGNTEVKKDLEGNFEFTLAPLSFALLQNGEHFE